MQEMNLAPKDGFPYYFALGNTGSFQNVVSANTAFTFLEAIGEEKSKLRYQPDKWSIKQVVGHLADHERINSYQAFLFSRKIDVPLWGYDQVALVNQGNFDALDLSVLITDLKNLRNVTLSFINTLSQRQLDLVRNIRGHEVTLQQYLIAIIGHETHHINLIKEKYL